jgi:hypothetical protein
MAGSAGCRPAGNVVDARRWRQQQSPRSTAAASADHLAKARGYACLTGTDRRDPFTALAKRLTSLECRSAPA